MKCLLVTSIFPPIRGGSAVVYEMLCRYSPTKSIVVLAPKKNYSTNEYLEGWREFDASAPFPVHRVKILRPLIIHSKSIIHSILLQIFVDIPLKIKLFAYTLWLIRKYKIDVLCIGELNSLSWLGQLTKRLFGLKVINYIHGEEVTTETSYRRFGKRRYVYLHQADAIVAVSRFTGDYLANRFNLDSSRVSLIPNGVDLGRFTPAEKPPYLVERYGLHEKDIILFVGRLVPRKGIDNTLKALPGVIRSIPNIHYVIVGTGPQEAELQSLAQALDLVDYVTFAGKVSEEELSDHYRLCDIFVMPNRTMPDGDTEGFGLVFLEANACGKPVIGGQAGGAVEAVDDQYNGLSVNGFDPEEIGQSIVSLLSNSELYDKLAANGLVHTQTSGFSKCATLFEELCERLVAENE
jgi:phosphatidyl-myo-inositol dimannoside synthase